MKNERYVEELLGIKPGEDNHICISVIVPLYKQLPERNQNKLAIKNAVNEAKNILQAGFSDGNISGLIRKLDELQTPETFAGAAEGVGFFVGEEVGKTILFPFEVKKKVVVDNSFEVRDVIFTKNRMPRYYVLALSNNKTRFFISQQLGIEEVINESFPLSYEEQFQYPARQKPKVSGNYGSEESTIQEERQKGFYRHLDKLLAPYFKRESRPVILLGVSDQQAVFKKTSRYSNNIAAGLNGNFDHLSGPEVFRKIWPEVTRLLEKKDDEVISKLERLSSVGKTITGVEQIWKEAGNMTGKTLVVEKDFSQSAYVDRKIKTLSLKKGKGQDWQKIHDVVDDIIELTIGGHGEVIFVENGRLGRFQKIALMSP